MRKNLQITALAVALAIGTAGAQTGKVASQNQPVLGNTGGTTAHKTATTRTCGTELQHGPWDNLTPAEIKELEKTNYGTMLPGNNAKQMVAYTIPVIFHIVHTAGSAVGVGNNISQAQILNQLTILNNDMKSLGLNNGLCPAVFAPVKADAELTFCLATKNPTGGILVEPGIDRRAHTSITGLATPGAGYSTATCDATIKPQTIWDPLRYCNVWVTELNGGLLGYATFPIGTGLTGITGNGTATSDGVVCDHNFIGSIGTGSAPPYNQGRTLVHELGHWLGLRHINGDANCGNDFVTDTPTQDQLHGGCIASTGTYHANVCSGTAGEMTMNYMDYTDDACMYMWSAGQKARMQQAMANGTFRNQLSASSVTLCSLAAATPTANILAPATGCAGTAVTPTNNSTGSPAPTYVWSTTPATGVTYNPNNTATAPLITFASAGNFTITCVATNSLGNNSNSKPISITSCAALCNDTIMNITNTQTMTIATAGSDTTTPGCSPKAGYIYGSNCYQDQEKAEFFPLSMYSSIPTPKIKSVIVVFYKDGTKGTGGNTSTAVNMKLYTGTMAGGPTATATPIGVVNSNIGNILAVVATNSLTYVGAPVVYTNPILRPYRFLLATPVNAPATNGFFASIKVPTTPGDTATIMHVATTTGTNWEYWSPSNWYNVTTAWGGFNGSMAILPEITCSPVSVNENSVLDKSIAIMPNPSTGIVNVMTFLPNAQDINITVTNMLGQEISNTDFSNVASNSFTVDLTTKDNGVYFISIRNGEERIVKRVVIAK